MSHIRHTPSLDHPHILRLLGFFEEPTQFHIVLELAPEGDVLQFMRRMTWRNWTRVVRKILWQVVQALAYLESVHVAHRDIKPENILLMDGMRVKLADFGWAVWYKPGLARNRTLCGTPEYIPPELLASRKLPYHAEFVDAWMLGVLVIELMQGRTPFRPSDPDKSYDKVIFHNIRCFKTINQIDWIPRSQYRDLAAKLLRKDPLERRPASDLSHHPFFAKMAKEARLSSPTVAQRCQLFQNT